MVYPEGVGRVRQAPQILSNIFFLWLIWDALKVPWQNTLKHILGIFHLLLLYTCSA